MSLTAASSGLVILLLTVPVIQGQRWRVTYTDTHICASKGSTVKTSCTYWYPSSLYEVQKRFWFSKGMFDNALDLTTDSDYTGRVENHCDDRKQNCTLTIRDLRESDSVRYRFRFTTRPSNAWTGDPGVTLFVTDPDLQVLVERSSDQRSDVELKCHSSFEAAGGRSFVWYKNEQKIKEETFSIRVFVNDPNRYSCALKGCEDHRSPPVYAPKLPSVSVSPSAEIVEGSSVTLTCSSDANPAANYIWYKGKDKKRLSEQPQLAFISIQPSESGQYYCEARNEMGATASEFISIDVKYAPKLPSVSVSPSAEIVEGSSVNLTCSSDANPAANYTWYKENQTLPQGAEGVHHFSSISSEDRGTYHCKSENLYGEINSRSLFVDVLYAPKLPSVSVSPSAEIVEGSSVTLTCSSDANPAANYTWYKEGEDSPKGSGQIFAITDLRPEHSGNYYCEAQNTIGRQKSTLNLTVLVEGRWKLTAVLIFCSLGLAVVITAVLLWIIFLSRKKKVSEQRSGPEERPDNREQTQPAEQQDNLHYASIQFFTESSTIYSNVGVARARKHNEKKEEGDMVEYAAVAFKSTSAVAPQASGQEDPEDLTELYSTVKKPKAVTA